MALPRGSWRHGANGRSAGPSGCVTTLRRSTQTRRHVAAVDPEVVNAEGFTQTPGPNVECLDSTDGEGNWGTTIDDGEKKSVYDTWVIPEGATAITLEDHRIELPS